MRDVDTGFTALHMFLTKSELVASFMVVWGVSVVYMFLVAIPNAIDIVDYDYPIEDMVAGIFMTTASIILLFELQICTSEWRSILEVLGWRRLIICSLLIFLSFPTIATDRRRS